MKHTRQLFGTDGIRGVAGEFPLTVESTYMIGRALGHDLIRRAVPRAVEVRVAGPQEGSRGVDGGQGDGVGQVDSPVLSLRKSAGRWQDTRASGLAGISQRISHFAADVRGSSAGLT